VVVFKSLSSAYSRELEAFEAFLQLTQYYTKVCKW
jgi:hypothetical protein